MKPDETCSKGAASERSGMLTLHSRFLLQYTSKRFIGEYTGNCSDLFYDCIPSAAHLRHPISTRVARG
jgi:hypothetical protein